jgi:NodT family efflux transporter outer membrane factor (OMF) lipoprotein
VEAAQGTAQTRGGCLETAAAWWCDFDDQALAALIDTALLKNFDLRVAASRVTEARALASAQSAAGMPALDFAAGGDRSRRLNALGVPYAGTNHEARFQVSYELDLWGRVAAQTTAMFATYEASRATRDAVELAVAATVAHAYVNLRSYDAQLAIALDTLTSRERSLDLTRARRQNGYASALELAQAESEARAAAGAIASLRLAVLRQNAALNVLLGRASGSIERGRPLEDIAARALPKDGLPSDLVRRRPDIAAAELQLVAADAQLVAARDQLLPSVRLSASLGSTGASVLQGGPFTLWTLGASVLAPLFNGGRLRSLAEASLSRRDQALIGYERSVVTAFSEVETQLFGVARLQEQLGEAQAQRDALAEVTAIASRRYRFGYASYLDELVAQRSLFSAQLAVVQVRAELLHAEIGVYQALGGGWQQSQAK